MYQFTYDAAGRLTGTTDPLGGTQSVAYDRLDRVVSRTDELGRVTSATYDLLGRTLTVTTPASGTTTFTYYAVGNQLTRTNALGQTWTTTYDALNRPVTTTDPLSRTTTYGYDALDRVTEVTDPLGAITLATYTPTGELALATDPLGNETAFTYNAFGNRLSMTDPLGRDSTATYDALGRRLTQTDPAGEVTTYTYDALDRLLSLTDASGNTSAFTYDAVGNLLTDTNGAGKTRTYQYDLLGRRVAAEDRNGRDRTFAYDAAGRLTTETWYDGSSTAIREFEATYDAAGGLTSLGDGSSLLEYAFDTAGRLASLAMTGDAAFPEVALSRGYNAVGRRTSLSATVDSTADFLNAYQYDAAGQLTRLTQAGQSGGNMVAEKRVDFTYRADGLLSGIARFNSLSATTPVLESAFTYDSAGRLAGLTHTAGSVTRNAYTWTYDAASRITVSSSSDGTVSYTHDLVDQLTGVDNQTLADESFSYDATGNRTGTGTTVAAGNRLLSDGTYSYEYDDEGNRTKRTELSSGNYTTYTWDHRNRLTDLRTYDDADTLLTLVHYTYDARDLRIGKDADATGSGAYTRGERYVYDVDDNLVLVYAVTYASGVPVAGSLATRQFSAATYDALFASESATGDMFWALTDHLGTVRV